MRSFSKTFDFEAESKRRQIFGHSEIRDRDPEFKRTDQT